MPTKVDYVLTIDAGGTKCEALLMTTEGTALGFHAVYPDRATETSGHGRGREIAATLQAIKGAMREVDPAQTLHLVTNIRLSPGDIRRWLRVERILLWSAEEAEAAMAWAGVKEGLVALAGTGAFGHLMLKGARWHADGLGPLVGDWGSAYQIGREGLRAALRPDARTALREELAAIAGVSATPGVSTWGALESEMCAQGIRMLPDRTAVAHYATMVDHAARAGDAEAIAILEREAVNLAETLRYLVEKANAAGCALPLIGTGGVIRHSDIYWERLIRQVATFLPGVQPIRQDLPEAAGRALAGLEQAIEAGACQVDFSASRERLLASLPSLLAETVKHKETP